eukprot:gene30513-35541_t
MGVKMDPEEEILPGWRGEVASQSYVRETSNQDIETSKQQRASKSNMSEGSQGLRGSRLSLQEDQETEERARCPGSDSVVEGIERKIAEWTGLPVSHGEPIEVLRYKNGQKYDAHWDWFEDIEDGLGNRMATVLMYLAALFSLVHHDAIVSPVDDGGHNSDV